MPTAPLTRSLAFLTADLPGIGGTLKQRAKDFRVEEIPLYPPKGSGEHLLLFIEKQQQTTSDVVRRLAKLFSVKRSDIGFAGLKDKHAITRQHFSVYLPDPSKDEKCLARFEFLPFNLIWSARHQNKLRRGHLRGNRFVIHIRDVPATSVVAAKLVLDRLVVTGVPNYVGHQRFGYRQNNHVVGKLLVQGKWQAFLDHMLGKPQPDVAASTSQGREHYERGDFKSAIECWPRHLRHDRQALDALRQGKSPREAVMAIDGQQREFLVSAMQSAVFNAVLHRRMEGHDSLAFDRLAEGDLAWKHENRSVFAVDRETAEHENGEQGRIPILAISPSGPMWGPDMMRAQGVPGKAEADALAQTGLSECALAAASHQLVYGTRRPMRVAVTNAELSGGADEYGPYVRVVFDLPRGSYATVALREIMKVEERNAAQLLRENLEPPSR